MPISTMQWHIEIRISVQDVKLGFPQKIHKELIPHCFCSLGICFVFVLRMLLICGNIGLNLGLRNGSTSYNFSISLWNLSEAKAC